MTDTPTPALHFHSCDDAPIALEGFPWRAPGGEFFRLPLAIQDTIRKPLRWVAAQPSGGVLRLRTDSRRLAIRARLGRGEHFGSTPWNCESGFDVYVGSGGAGGSVGSGDARCSGSSGGPLCFFENLSPAAAPAAAPSIEFEIVAHRSLPEGENAVAIYTPILNPLLELAVGLDEGARIAPPTPHAIARPFAFYGSSITQGFCASRPGLTYAAMVCRALDAPLVNVGFGGQALGDPEVARAIAGLDLACFVLDYDHNSSGAEHLLKTHEPFFRTVRDAHPGLPIVIVTSPNFRADTDYFGKRADAIRGTYDNAVARGDRYVHFVHGRDFFPEPWEDCTVDRLHPNDAGFAHMARVIVEAMRQALASA